MELLVIIGIVYLVSTILMWRLTRGLYTKDGYFENQHPDLMDIIATITPVVNTIGLIFYFTREDITFGGKEIKDPNKRRSFFPRK